MPPRLCHLQASSITDSDPPGGCTIGSSSAIHYGQGQVILVERHLHRVTHIPCPFSKVGDTPLGILSGFCLVIVFEGRDSNPSLSVLIWVYNSHLNEEQTAHTQCAFLQITSRLHYPRTACRGVEPQRLLSPPWVIWRPL